MKRWDCIARRFKKAKGNIIGVEVGVWKGTLSHNLLKVMPMLTLYLVDRWCAYTPEEQERDGISQQRLFDNKVFKKAQDKALKSVKPYGKRAIPMVMDSEEASKTFEDKYFDFVFLDGDHSYEGLTQDIGMWLPKVKTGGYLCGHDYDSRPGVKKAVDEAFGPAVKPDENRTWFYRKVH